MDHWASQVVLVVKNPPANAGDPGDVGSIPGLGRSPRGGHDNHSTALAWRLPWTEEPGRLQSVGWHRAGHDWSDLAGTHTNGLLRYQCFVAAIVTVLVYEKHLNGNHDGMNCLMFNFQT